MKNARLYIGQTKLLEAFTNFLVLMLISDLQVRQRKL
jgi:hypothetical protein